MRYKLSDICEYAKGKIKVSVLDENTYISTENMLPNKCGITKATSLPTQEQTQAFMKNDVLVSNIRPYFKKIWYATCDGGCSNDVLVFRAKDGVSCRFLYYVLADDTFFDYSMATSKGTKMPRGDKKAIMEYEVPDLSYEDQCKIASILEAIDEKICLNTAINKNLLQQAGAIFNKFYDESPNQQPFTSLIEVFGGGTPKTGNRDFWDGPIPFFTPKDVGTPYTFQTEKYITESGLAHCNSRLYHKDTTFVTARGTVGKVSLAGIPMAMNQSCYALASEIVDPLLVYFYVLKAVASLKHKASGAVFDAIVTRDFDSETINVLSDDDAKSVLAIINPMMEAIHNNSEENIRLVALRDSLMPRLMSGEIDVSDIDF